MSKNVLTVAKDKRIAIFASYSKQGIVPNYVLQYLEYLKEVASVIIFLADNQAPIEEQAKLKNLVTYAHFEPHGEYDFGSYKRGFYYAKQHHLLDDAEEVILVNDSCYAISGFKTVFAQMSKKPCDFWGMTESLQIAHHLQSFFLVFKKPLFLALEHYLAAVTHQNTVSEVILQYEVPLKGQLELLGFKGASFTDIFREDDPTRYQNSLITCGKVPLIKKKIFTPILNSF